MMSGAALAHDRVVARAARELVACLAADDRVVARAAVDRQADRAQRVVGVRCPVEQVRVDHVVAAVEERVREREDEERRAVADPVQDAGGRASPGAGNDREVGPLGKSATLDREVEVIVVFVTALTIPTYWETALTAKSDVRERRQLRAVRARARSAVVDVAKPLTVHVPGQRRPIVTCWPILKPSATHEPVWRVRCRCRCRRRPPAADDCADDVAGPMRQLLADREAVREERAGAVALRDQRDRSGVLPSPDWRASRSTPSIVRHRLRPEVVQ